jgi:TolB protein
MTMTKNVLPHLILTLFLLVGAALPAHAQLEFDLTKGRAEALPIAVQEFHAGAPQHAQMANEIPNIIAANLERSGLFKPAPKAGFLQTAQSVEQDGVRFDEWRAGTSQALVTGKVFTREDGQTRVEFRLWDVFGEKQLTGMAYTTTSQNWRRVAHIIADEIYHRLTGEKGYFDTRIVYIAESGATTSRRKRLAIMDQDGANHKYLTDGNSLVLTPRFSPTEQLITYMSYESGSPRVYLYNLTTGAREILGNFPGMTFAPRFSPDGKKVVMSQAVGGNSDLYELTLSSRSKKRLTDDSSIDTSPSYSPDGNQIVFESDRGGTQQLYIMGANGGDAKRITFGKGRYANPVWSPRGDLIAFTRMYQGKFYIGVIRPDGSGERLITEAYHVEGPSWSPNGRVLTYFKERPTGSTRQARVYTIDITGFNERVVETPGDASDPAWSPLN